MEGSFTILSWDSEDTEGDRKILQCGPWLTNGWDQETFSVHGAFRFAVFLDAKN